MNGNKKIAKKIVAGSMAVMMAAGLAGTYEYHNNVMQVQAAEQKDKDTQELKETAENVLADHATDSEDTNFFATTLKLFFLYFFLNFLFFFFKSL